MTELGSPALATAIALAIFIGLIGWMIRVSIAFGKVIEQLRSINDKLGGQLDWLKALDTQVDDHERRITKIEAVPTKPKSTRRPPKKS